MSDSGGFTVVEVNECDAPFGTDDTTWSEYVVANRHTSIVGKNRGSTRQTLRYARQFAEELNARAKTGYSAFSPRRQAGQFRRAATR